ncbi:phosphoribosylaminoimidazole carboxylase ATPase subunit [Moraxella macacae 0408225]|uniref:N5-carboxyaminoimidazole ribonucleotide synthase n=1 Tax=Moraxella macacae 0408225 TaxID=1230338 RepID=L2F866_9GAMM|nr:5-(carboxyamino)imidazole ribonucleotide synthase [Moraxella macacae]ELA08971.1 phosphoribosylaminoimidazole carboxylase ATPase subunit [Moraxella macacae 0408225]
MPISTANFYTVNHAKHSVKTIGILGGGQLGLMLAQSALPLGIRCVFLEDVPNCPARLLGKVYSTEQLDDFADACDVFSLEFENTPLSSAKFLEEKTGLFPPSQALFITQDRLKEKHLFKTLNIKTVPFVAVSTKHDVKNACDTLGLPLVLKTTRGGYDGKGQFVIKTVQDIDTAWTQLGDATTTAPLIAEQFVNFDREVSIIAVRSQFGEIRYYPLVENEHRNGILAKTTAPASNVEQLADQAQDNIKKLLEHLNYVGVLTLELFVTSDGLIANEIAPRVHNSGHWSIEGAVCSQFENHMRAVAGLPLGDTRIVKPSVMLNVIGKYPNLTQILALDGVHYHGYDKQENAGRKIAHITIMPTDTDKLNETVAKVEALLNSD